MKIDTLPFLHYLVRVGEGKNARLLSPYEIKDPSVTGGSFAAPVKRDGALLPAYRFHFSIYRGLGKFVKERGQKQLFTGTALSLPVEGRDQLLLTFGLPWPEPLWLPYYWHHPRDEPQAENEIIMPLLRRVPRRSPLRYGGSGEHRDFKHRLAELEPCERGMLDRILNLFHISILGCDPHTQYEMDRAREAKTVASR